jgi:hypothetical protein
LKHSCSKLKNSWQTLQPSLLLRVLSGISSRLWKVRKYYYIKKEPTSNKWHKKEIVPSKCVSKHDFLNLYLSMNFCRSECKEQYQLLCTLYNNDMKRSHYAQMIIHRFHIGLKTQQKKYSMAKTLPWILKMGLTGTVVKNKGFIWLMQLQYA